MPKAAILGLGSYLPEKCLTNKELENMVETSDEWIRTRTGILERRQAASEEAASDLAVKAARSALNNAGISPEKIDLIIVATVTPDMAFPATACIIQEQLGAKNAAAFDLEAGCSGFIYGVTVASQFVLTGMYRYCLVVGVEVLSKITNWEDRNTCVLFGDGAGAAVIGPVDGDCGILAYELGADGSGGPNLYMPAGGSRIPASEKSVSEKLHTIHMKGNDVFKFAVRIVPDTAEKLLEKAGISKAEIDWFIPHQANIRIVEAAMKRLEQPMHKAYLNIERYGNMSAASVPVALDEAVKEGKLKKGDLVLIVGFGAGLTWGGIVTRWAY